MADVVVVGAGPYGLSIAAHLRAAGLGVRVFGDLMASWRQHMPAGMYLKSTPDASSLSAPQPGSTIFDYCAEIGSEALTKEDAIPIDLFIDYGMWFADRHVPDVEPEHGRRLVARGPATSRCSSLPVRRCAPDSVVVACGVIPYAYTPPELLALAPNGPSPRRGALAHRAARRPRPGSRADGSRWWAAGSRRWRARRCWPSPAPTSTCSCAAPRVLWGAVPDPEPATRMHRLVKPPSALGEGWAARSLSGAPGMVRYLPARARLALVKSVLGPSGAWWLRDRVEGQVDIRAGRHRDVRGRARRRAGRSPLVGVARRQRWRRTCSTSTTCWPRRATGSGSTRSASSSPSCESSLRCVAGSPLLDASFESSVPGLYFSGLTAAATFGPLLRFVHGADFAATRIGAAVPEPSAPRRGLSLPRGLPAELTDPRRERHGRPRRRRRTNGSGSSRANHAGSTGPRACGHRRRRAVAEQPVRDARRRVEDLDREAAPDDRRPVRDRHGR